MMPIPELTPRERAAALVGQPWTIAEAVKDLRKPGLDGLRLDIARRRLAMAILSTLRGIDASASSRAFLRAWQSATAQIERKAKRGPRLAAWTPEQLRARAAGYIVLPGSYRPGARS